MPRIPESEESFWSSEKSDGYPQYFQVGNREMIFPSGIDVRNAIGKFMRQNGWIPNQGEILDLAAGPSSGFIFGRDVALKRVTAVDLSKRQMDKGPVPDARKHVEDLKHPENLPQAWNGRFGLVASIFSARYFTEAERQNLYSRCYNLLAGGGRIVVIDGKSNPADIAKSIGEVSEFDHVREERMLKDCRFIDTVNGSTVLPVETLDEGVTSTPILGYVKGVK